MTTYTPATATGAARLANGELRAMVARVLADNPGTEFGPRQISLVLGRSSGAIGNALDRLTGAGQAEQTNTQPRRYRATRTTATAAIGAAPARTPRPDRTPRRPRPA
ncbi:AAA family ATPase, partial [Nocardia sp. NPDC003482]